MLAAVPVTSPLLSPPPPNSTPTTKLARPQPHPPFQAVHPPYTSLLVQVHSRASWIVHVTPKAPRITYLGTLCPTKDTL